jgi:hypothetical protein|tara:strand:- start:1129 stop:1371 length:243 start_codon:yes stop_codon:yes gene_type:complete
VKELVLFVCALSNPDCLNSPTIIKVEYENNVLCHKVAQEAAAAILLPTDRLMSYSCEGKRFTPPHGKPFIVPVPDDETIG